MAGALLGGYCGGRFGPKTTMLASCLPQVLGWIIIAISPHFGPLILGRVLCGLGSSFFSSNCSLLVAQYRSVQVRAEIKKSPRIQISLKFRQAERRISVFVCSDDWPGNTGHLLPGSCPLLEVCLHHPSPPLPHLLHHSLAGSRVSTVAS